MMTTATRLRKAKVARRSTKRRAAHVSPDGVTATRTTATAVRRDKTRRTACRRTRPRHVSPGGVAATRITATPVHRVNARAPRTRAHICRARRAAPDLPQVSRSGRGRRSDRGHRFVVQSQCRQPADHAQRGAHSWVREPRPEKRAGSSKPTSPPLRMRYGTGRPRPRQIADSDAPATTAKCLRVATGRHTSGLSAAVRRR